MTTNAPTPSGPLRVPMFRALWIATIVSNIGTWMHDVGAGWLMTTLSDDPLMVALVQAATTLPMFLFALPGGALADIIDRRRLLMGAQLWVATVASVLALLTYAGLTGPYILLALTFAMASGAALSAPAFQSIVPELVPRAILPDAVALNSLGVNIARAIGPAVGGLIIALAGPPAVFALNTVSVFGVLTVLLMWRRKPATSALPAEHFFGALRTGTRYARQSPDLQTVLIRCLGFFPFASGLWALLPLIARRELGLGPSGYGGLLACMGCGAVIGALVLPWLRRKLSPNRLTVAATVAFAAATMLLGQAGSFVVAAAVMALAGFAWIAMLSTLNVAAQLAVPTWVKARALALYLVVFQGSMAAGATFWGTLAGEIGIPMTLLMAAAGLVAGLLLARRWKIGPGAARDLAPSSHWPAPLVSVEPAPDRGPVLIQIEYQIDPGRTAAFVDAMQALRRLRRRDGAISWALYEDAAQPGLMIEVFLAESWLEHLRQHERVTQFDRADQAMAGSFVMAESPPIVRHMLSAR
jgi:MFS family permease